MNKIQISICTLLALLFLSSTNSFAQRDTFDDIRLFQSFPGCPIAPNLYTEGSYTYSNFDFLDRTTIGAHAGYAPT